MAPILAELYRFILRSSLLIFLQIGQLVCHRDDPSSSAADVILSRFRNNCAPADKLVCLRQDEARPRELVRRGLAGLGARCWKVTPLSAFFATCC